MQQQEGLNVQDCPATSETVCTIAVVLGAQSNASRAVAGVVVTGPSGKYTRNVYAIGPGAAERALYLGIVVGLERAIAADFDEVTISCSRKDVANGIFNGQHCWNIDPALETALYDRLGQLKRWLIQSSDVPEPIEATGTDA